jgi:hypothetical protein
MQLVLGDGRADGRQVEDLVSQRPGILTLQGLTAAATGGGLEGVDLVGWQQGSLVQGMTGLPAPWASGGWLRWAPLDSRAVGRRGPGGVGGVLAQLLPQLIDLLLDGRQPSLVTLQKSQERGLGSGRDLVPQLSRNRRLYLHAFDVERALASGNPAL